MREEVIKLAYDYAIKYDIDEISLVKISNDLNISRRSIYRIFDNKHDLMYEVYKIIVDELLEEAHELNKSNKGDNGLILVREAMSNMIRVFLANPHKIKYITKFDALKIEDEELIEKKSIFYRKCDFTHGYLKIGVEDNSIKTKIDPYKMSCVLLETIIGIVSRYHDIANVGHSQYMDEEDIYSFVDVLSLYLSSK